MEIYRERETHRIRDIMYYIYEYYFYENCARQYRKSIEIRNKCI